MEILVNPEIDPVIGDKSIQPLIRYNLVLVCHSPRGDRMKETRGNFTHALGEGQERNIFEFYGSSLLNGKNNTTL